MTAEAKSCRKKWKIAVSILLAVLILLAGGFFWYVLCSILLPFENDTIYLHGFTFKIRALASLAANMLSTTKANTAAYRKAYPSFKCLPKYCSVHNILFIFFSYFGEYT